MALQLLEGEKPNEEALRKQHEALEISIYAREVLNPEKFEQFCRIVVNDTISNKQKFMELHTLVTGKMELQEMLLDILSAGESKINQIISELFFHNFSAINRASYTHVHTL